MAPSVSSATATIPRWLARMPPSRNANYPDRDPPAQRRSPRVDLHRQAERPAGPRVRRFAAVHRDRGLVRRPDPAAPRAPLLPPGGRGAEPRDDHRAVPARRPGPRLYPGRRRRRGPSSRTRSSRCGWRSSRRRRVTGADPGARESWRGPRATSSASSSSPGSSRSSSRRCPRMADLLRTVERAAETNILLAEAYLARTQVGDEGKNDNAPPAAGGALCRNAPGRRTLATDAPDALVADRRRLPDLPALVRRCERRRRRRSRGHPATPRPPRLARRRRDLALAVLPVADGGLRVRRRRLHRRRSRSSATSPPSTACSPTPTPAG